jgi:hypothetical protein
MNGNVVIARTFNTMLMGNVGACWYPRQNKLEKREERYRIIKWRLTTGAETYAVHTPHFIEVVVWFIDIASQRKLQKNLEECCTGGERKRTSQEIIES